MHDPSKAEGAPTFLPPSVLRGWIGAVPPRLAGILDSRLALYEERFARNPAWPALALPRAILAGHGAPAEGAECVLAGCALFFLAADIVDDAEDGDLPADLSWAEAVNAGHSLLFGALAAFSAAVPTGGVAEAFASAGRALASGQSLDLSLDWNGEADEDLVMAAVRGKAGASMALYARMAASACGLPCSAVDRWAEVGERMGMAVQLRSDLADLENPGSRDLKARRLTLPLAYGIRRSPQTVRPALESGEQYRVVAALRQCGAITFAEFKIEALILEAVDLLAPLGLTEGARARIEAVLRSCTREPSSP